MTISDEIQEFRESFLNNLNVIATFESNSYPKDEHVTDFMEAAFYYAKAQRLVDNERSRWDRDEKEQFVGNFLEAIESLEEHLDSAIQSLDYNDPVSNKIYKSTLVFLREDIFNIYKAFERSTELINKAKDQLDILRNYEDELFEPINSYHVLPDLTGVPVAHHWWRDSILMPSSEEIDELRKLFFICLKRVAALSDESRSYTNGHVSDLIWAIFEYGRAREVVEGNEFNNWGQDERKTFVNLFPKSVEKLNDYLPFAIRNLDKEDPVSNKVYKSALVFLHHIFDIYDKLTPSKNSIKEITIQMSFLNVEGGLSFPKNNMYDLPDLRGVPDSHKWWRDEDQCEYNFHHGIFSVY